MYIYTLLFIIILCVDSVDDLDNNSGNIPQEHSVQTNANQTDGDSVVSRNIIERGLGHIVYGSYGSESINTTQQSDTDGSVEQPSGSEENTKLVGTGDDGSKSGSEHEDDEDEQDKDDEEDEDDEDDENFDVREVSGDADVESGKDEPIKGIQSALGEINPELASTEFVGLDDKGNSFPMDNTHYYVTSESFSEIKFELVSKLIQIKHKKKTVWDHEKGAKHPESIIYKKLSEIFIVIFEDIFISCKCVNGNWKIKKNRVPRVRLFNVNYTNKLCQIETSIYKTEYSEYNQVKLCIGKNLMCTMIKVEEQVLWEKKYNERYPIFVICHGDKKISVAFKRVTYIYICQNGIWIFEKSVKIRRR
ncbi:SVSP family protein [Theileria parva strain Muguga]|uniref:Theileria-specific sub-telomeric protein, SVSP family n=1 Tax=Theileria parva TaxID=5875 RepID=Q4MYH4_THEPA|nr:SVSP family protein [Theileria parva strain Muguga]EAN30708.1 SVSP family protein [Theileria parva strain Muguga]|eukprot:XP_762991.1 hypothetical protein [Theileria parva strain Muguga]